MHAAFAVAWVAFALGASGAGPSFDPVVARYLRGADACFVLADDRSGTVRRFNAERCARRLPPCSTFKIANALIGLEVGALPDADHVIAWDGVERPRAVTNQNQTLRTAVRDSVAWYFQESARRVGQPAMHAWLEKLDYGNRDTSAGLTTFWLGTSLEISADEQVEFLRRLYERRLPVSDRSLAIVKEITTLQRGDGYVYRGKTGSDREPKLGWFIGWIEYDDGPVYFAANTDGAYGYEFRATVEAILRELELLPAAD